MLLYMFHWNSIVCQNMRDLQPKLQIHEITSAKRITMSCYVPLDPSVATPARMYMETYGDSPLHVRIMFHTELTTNSSCTESKTTEITLLDSFNRKVMTESVFDKNRYSNGLCFVDGNGMPSREIIINIDPVTNFDLTWWRCVLETARGNIITTPKKEGDLITPYGFYHDSSLTKHNRFIDLRIEVDRDRKFSSDNGYLPLSCTTSNVSVFHTPPVQDYKIQPWKSFKIKMSAENRTFVIETDMFGRLNSAMDIHWDSVDGDLQMSKCPLFSQYETTCLNKEYMHLNGNEQTGNLLWDTTQCSNFTLFASTPSAELDTNVITIRTLFDYGLEFDSKCNFDSYSSPFDPECMSYPGSPIARIEIRNKVILELPSVSNYHCFPIFNTHFPYIFRKDYEHVYVTHKMLLCPDQNLLFDVYKEVIDSMQFYKKMEIKFIAQPKQHHYPQVELSCGTGQKSKLIYVSSGSCNTSWCGERNNERYSVRTMVLENGQTKLIRKKTNVYDQNTHLMTCLWRIYFCFSEVRNDKLGPAELTLVERKSNLTSMSTSFFGRNQFHIMPWECPPEEEYHQKLYRKTKSPRYTIDIEKTIEIVTNRLYAYVDKISHQAFSRLLYVQKNVSLDLLQRNDYQNCICQTRPTVCPSNTIENDIFSTNLLLSQIGNVDDQTPINMWCEAFDLKSKKRPLSEMAVEYLCHNDVPDHVVRLGAQLLPQPKITFYPYEGYADNIIIACDGIPQVCLETTSSPIVSILFWNNTDHTKNLQWTHYFYKANSHTPEVCWIKSGFTTCHGINLDTDSKIFIPPKYLVKESATSVAMKYSLLTDYTHVRCTYALGKRHSPVYNIERKLNKTIEMCMEKDYAMFLVKSSDKTVACKVSYSVYDGTCKIPIVSLIVNNTSPSWGHLVQVCNPHHSTNKPQCLFDTYQNKSVTAVISSPLSLLNDSMITCSYTGVRTITKSVKFFDLPTSCVKAPHFFNPHIDVDETRNTSVVVSCEYPTLIENTCAAKSPLEVKIYLDKSSMFLEHHSVLLAQRLSEANKPVECFSAYHKYINCSTDNPPSKNLIKISVPYLFNHFSHVALQPSPSLNIYCVLGKYRLTSKKVYMRGTLKRAKYLLSQNEHLVMSKHIPDQKTQFTNDVAPKKISNITIGIVFLISVVTVFGVLFLYCGHSINSKTRTLIW